MSFITFILYIFAIYIRPQEWVPQIYAWPLVNILAITCAILIFFEKLVDRKLRILESQILFLLAFLAVIVLSHISHRWFGGAYSSFLKFGTNVVMFFLFVNILNSEKKIKIAIWAIIIMTAILALQGICQSRAGVGWAGQPLSQVTEQYPQGRITWVGIFNDPNDLALAFVMALGLLLAITFGRTSFALRLVSIPLGGLLLYALYLTNSRGGYLAIAATVAYYFLRRIKKKSLAILVGAVLAFMIIIVGPSRMSEMSAQEDSAHGRIEAWYQGFQMLKSYPLFGVGYGMFTDYHERTAHNSYILVAAEEGLVGFFIWIALIYSCFKGLRILIERSDGFKAYALGLESALFGFLCAAYFLSRSYVTLFYVILALVSSAIYVFLKKEDYRFRLHDARIASALGLAIMALVWISTRVSLRLFG